MKHFWKCFQDSEPDKDGGFEAVHVDRPIGIPVKYVKLCYAEISHFVVLISDVISIHVKFDQFKKFYPVADPGSLNFWNLLQTQQARGYVFWVLDCPAFISYDVWFVGGPSWSDRR
jgi:hypothetical protein